MRTMLEIESAIAQLPESELPKLTAWYDEFIESKWDERIARYAESGALDFLIAEVDQGKREGTLRKFP